MKKNLKILLDMDNTLNLFDEKIQDIQNQDIDESEKSKLLYELMNSKGFFENLEPSPFLSEINKLAAICPENIYVVSACIPSKYCKKEKIAWLKKYLPEACKENIIFTKVGENKAEKVRKFLKVKEINEYFVLVDDYGKNILEWEARGGTGIKFKTEFNTSDSSKYKYIIKDFSEFLSILEQIRKGFSD